MAQNKNLSVVTYAAGASLAAIALVYVFAPTYLIDESSSSSRRSGNAVGLANVGNDCFINSVLQALAGLGELRLYLIRETHRRAIDSDVYTSRLVQPHNDNEDGSSQGVNGRRKRLQDWQLRSLQSGAVTAGLKEILDRLNERPIFKKSISPRGFVGVLEGAFGQTINRQQQDAQEFLQLLIERLQDEYKAGKRARAAHARRMSSAPEEKKPGDEPVSLGADTEGKEKGAPTVYVTTVKPSEGESAENSNAEEAQADGDGADEPGKQEEEEQDFPLEGEREAQSECQTCGFKTTPRKEVFCMLTLSVPQVPSTTLDACFDGLFRTEHIPDYKCDKCRLLHARDVLRAEHAQATSDSFRAEAEASLEKLQRAIDEDPEHPPLDVALPDAKYAPKSTIARAHRITRYPKVLVVHLSRSIYDRTSQKNMAKVSFPESLKLGGLRDRKGYRLLGVVTHKGGHQSGHYQSFRRQVVHAPFSNPHTVSGVYNNGSSSSKAASGGASGKSGLSPAASMPDLLSAAGSTSGDSAHPRPSEAETVPKDKSETGSIRSVAASALSRLSPTKNGGSGGSTHGADGADPNAGDRENGAPSAAANKAPLRPKKRKPQKWWRFNDEKCKEARMSEVLDMEREVYLLFYELESKSGE